jgi:hypothetical protein
VGVLCGAMGARVVGGVVRKNGWGCVCINDTNLEFLLLRIEVNFNRRVHVTNIGTWLLRDVGPHWEGSSTGSSTGSLQEIL